MQFGIAPSYRETYLKNSLTVMGLLLTFTTATAFAGYGAARQPVFTLLVASVPIVLVLLFSNATFRFGFVTFGGLVVLQSSQGLGSTKLIYMVGCAIAVGIAFVRTSHFRSRHLSPILLRLARMSLAWISLVAISFAISMANGTAVSSWLRDAIPYLLIAAVPYLAMDLAANSLGRPRSVSVEWLFIVYGAVAVIGFSANWLERRGYVDLGLLNLLFSTFAFPAALLSYATAKYASSRSQMGLWAGMAGAIFTLMVLTGTRTSLVLLAAPIIVFFSRGKRLGFSIPRFLLLISLGAFTGGTLFTLLTGVLDIDTDIIATRFYSLSEITGDGALGQSFGERAGQTAMMWDAFTDSPIFGVGPGHIYTWFTANGVAKSAFVLDSPLSILSKFGVLGLSVFLYMLGSLWALQKYLHFLGPRAQVERDALRAFLAIVILLSLLGSPIDDKGFSFAVAFLLALSFQRILVLRVI